MKSKHVTALVACLLCAASIPVLADSLAHPAVADTARHVATGASGSPTNFPNYHPLIVHFPIVLLVFATFLQVLAHWKKELNLAVLILLVCGTISAWLAAELLDAHPNTKALSAEAKQIYHLHHQFSDYTTWLATAASLLKIFTFFMKKGKMAMEVAVLLVLAGAATTVCAAGHYGSYLVHVEGVGPKGNLLRE